MGDFIDQLSGIRDVTLSGVHFEISNRTSLLNTARATAFRNARATAEMFANLGGFRLQSIQRIV